MIRGTIVEMGKDEGRDSVDVVVRAASKFGASLAARAASTTVIPTREQEVVEIRNISNSRLFDQWMVTVRDRKELDSVGR